MVGVLQVYSRCLTSGILGTSNEQDHDENYSNISVLFELGQYVWLPISALCRIAKLNLIQGPHA